MKNWIQILIITIIIFIIITLMTMKIETPFDGNDTYGFPFTFHKTLSGRTFPIPENHNRTNLVYLVVDLVISGISAFGIFSLYKKLKNE